MAEDRHVTRSYAGDGQLSQNCHAALIEAAADRVSVAATSRRQLPLFNMIALDFRKASAMKTILSTTITVAMSIHGAY